MREVNVAVLGATGAVGREMLTLLEDFPIKSLRCLASAKSANALLPFRGGFVAAEAVKKGCFEGCDIVLGAASAALARELASEITASGAVFVDNSSAFRARDDVPLVIPEINAASAEGHSGIIASPNCSTTIALTAIWPIARQFGLKSMTAATYQAVSGAGTRGIRQLEAELAGESVEQPAFPHPIAFNVIPAIGGADDEGYTSEEMKMQREGRKILGLPGLNVSCTCVRVPVARCHCVALSIETEAPVSVQQARAALQSGDGVRLCDDLSTNEYPMPLGAQGQSPVLVGRVRRDLTRRNGLTLFCCGDQLLKGAAANAVQIARLLL